MDKATDAFLKGLAQLDGYEMLPEEMRTIVQLLMAKEVTGFVLVAELTNGNVLDAISVDLHGEATNRFVLVGGLENVKRDILRLHIKSRDPYIRDMEDDES